MSYTASKAHRRMSMSDERALKWRGVILRPRKLSVFMNMSIFSSEKVGKAYD